MEETIGVTKSAQIPKERRESLLDNAVRYAEERHWDVFPGTWLEAVPGGRVRCSCDGDACRMPGAHPVRPDWSTQATGSAGGARRLWSKHPDASVLLPTGRTFDAIEVSETAGLLALARMERMDMMLGPVTHTPDRRMYFFVLPGSVGKMPDLVRSLGWMPSVLGLSGYGEGRYVVAPPTRVGGYGVVQWARKPTPANRWLPDVESLIGPLAYARGREMADARDRDEEQARRGDRIERAGRTYAAERAERAERRERAEHREHAERRDHLERRERMERVERRDRAERMERADAVAKRPGPPGPPDRPRLPQRPGPTTKHTGSAAHS